MLSLTDEDKKMTATATATAKTFKVNVRKKNIKKPQTVEVELEVGQKVRYVFFANITFEGFDEKDQAILKDKSGDIKLVPRWMFEKYVEVEI
jgi:tRNA(Ser,Leu) C12 N-acetylase TAN1